MNKIIPILSLSAFTLFSIAGCDNKQQQETETVVQNTEAQSVESSSDTANPDWPTYVVATDPSNAPFELRNEQGTVDGFDVDLIKAIAKAEQFNVDVIPQPWSGVFQSLDSGERDILIAPLTINAERDELVDFTIPYIYPTRTAYLLPETAAKLGINTYQDLPKAQIAAKKATTNISSLVDDFGEANLNLVPVDSQYLALTAVTSGQAQAGFGDTAVLQHHAREMNGVDFVTIEQTLNEPVKAGFAVQNGNTELAELLNKGIKTVVADGTYRQLAIKWFGEELGNQIADRTQKYMGLNNSSQQSNAQEVAS
ncbi:substrate-binding periplasmic protein [Psychrobacter sp. I-STPA6b]|uniref:substrate-binding periplasmic protein n=1 Tax=Psychrobacter sp. I-STPA6b TaxID=2585718 RepID=UPI001D0CBD06|nr:transporter substrate-binding domain-containing protein [Psychrobacter sp. I-STPA6b]